MMKGLQKRITYPNIALTLALVLAMTGGAYAAGKYVITSTKQISPKVLKALQGKTGPAGKDGINGKDGAPGAPGEKGAPGSPGATGGKGAAGESVAIKEVKKTEAACEKRGGSEFAVGASTGLACNGKEGPEGPAGPQGTSGTTGKDGPSGKEGSPWVAGGVLPSGKTETGVFSFAAGTEGQSQWVPIAFPIPLSAPLVTEEVNGVTIEHVFYVKEGESPAPAACQGSVGTPTATAGNLCVYEKRVIGGQLQDIFRPSEGPAAEGADVSGATLFFAAKSPTEKVAGFGTWAVTAG